jgi:hypothetical protein
MKAKVKNMEGMLEAMRGGDTAAVSARLGGGGGGGGGAVGADALLRNTKFKDDPAIAAILSEPAVKALLDRCAARSRFRSGRCPRLRPARKLVAVRAPRSLSLTGCTLSAAAWWTRKGRKP